jgi:hypothetical protein
MTEERRAKIRKGVLRTIKLRRKRRTRAEIAADPLDAKRWDPTSEPGLANGRARVRDLRGVRAPGEERPAGYWDLKGCVFVPMQKAREHFARQAIARRPPAAAVADELADRLPWRI